MPFILTVGLELQWYKENIFLPPRSDTPPTASDSVEKVL